MASVLKKLIFDCILLSSREHCIAQRCAAGFFRGTFENYFAEGGGTCRWKTASGRSWQLRRISTDHPERGRKKRSRADYCRREWKLSRCIAAWWLCFRCATACARTRSRETPTIHSCFKPDCPRRYGYRYRGSLNPLGLWLSIGRDFFAFETKTSQRDWQTVPAAIKYSPLVSFLASHSLGEVLFGNSHGQSAVA